MGLGKNNQKEKLWGNAKRYYQRTLKKKNI